MSGEIQRATLLRLLFVLPLLGEPFNPLGSGAAVVLLSQL
jgi:hypothetical protein